MSPENHDPFALGDEDELATAEQLAALEFEPLTAESAAAMYHDFSAEPWAAECTEHGIALRFAYAIMKQTKDELIKITEEIEKEFPPPEESPTGQLLATLAKSRERFVQLASILKSAEARQVCAAAVVEIRLLGGDAA
jgi:hypothetical protein